MSEIVARVRGLLDTRFGRLALIAWFAVWSCWIALIHIVPGTVGSDTIIYRRAAEVWLNDGDPWSAAVGPFHFAGLPPTVQMSVIYLALPEWLCVPVGVVVSLAAAVAILRLLKLPLWWLVFPPVFEGIIVANPHLLIMLALLVPATIGRGWVHAAVSAAASLMKIYALGPLAAEFRFRAVAITGAGLVASFALSPDLWFTYAREGAAVSERLLAESAGGFSAWFYPPLVIPVGIAVLALATIDRRAAGWLAVPAIWPSSQLFYSTFALPFISPWLAVFLAPPIRVLPPIAITVWIVVRLFERSRERRRARVAPAAADSGAGQ